MNCQCMKCDKHTGTKDVFYTIMKNKRHRLGGICVECGRKKSQIISASKVPK